LFPEQWSGSDDFDTKENAPLRYDTFEVENGLNKVRED
jgi:hypothetical protein